MSTQPPPPPLPGASAPPPGDPSLFGGPPPPPSSQSKGCLKWGLIGCGAMLALFALLAIGIWVWVRNNGEEFAGKMEGVVQEGATAGAATDEAGCVAQGQQRAAGGGMGKMVTTTLWMESCLKHARETPGFCQGVPRVTEFGASVRWRQAQCAAAPGSKQACQGVMQSVQQYCTDGRPKAPASDSDLSTTGDTLGGDWSDTTAVQ